MNEKILVTAVIVWAVLYVLIEIFGNPYAWRANTAECWLIPAIWIDSIAIVFMSIVVVWN